MIRNAKQRKAHGGADLDIRFESDGKLGLVLVQNVVENRPEHIVVTPLKFTSSIAVKELGHNSRLRSRLPF